PLTDEGGVFGDMVIPLTREQVAAARANGGGDKVTIGFRPEATELVGPSDGGMPVKVELVEDLGAHANVYGYADINGKQERFVATIERQLMPQMGDTVYFKPTKGHHAFHAVTGNRI